MLHFISGSWTFLFFRCAAQFYGYKSNFYVLRLRRGYFLCALKQRGSFCFCPFFTLNKSARLVLLILDFRNSVFCAYFFRIYFALKKSGRYCTRFDKNMVIFENIPLNLPGEYRLAFRHSGGGCGIRTDVWQSPLRLCLCRDREGRV